jgi:hypothetical protein
MHAMGATEKVSLTMGHRELRLARTLAERAGLSLSSLVNAAVQRHLAEAIAEMRRRRAADDNNATFADDALPSPARVEAILRATAEAGPLPSEAEIRAFLRGENPAPGRRRRAGHGVQRKPRRAARRA